MNMHFILWGAGYRGKRLMDVLGKDRVIAFIDNDPCKIGTYYLDRPIISFGTYKRNYRGYIIVITPLYQEKEIACFLNLQRIYSYIFLSEVYAFFSPAVSFKKLPLYKYKFYDVIGIFGINLFSIILYEYMETIGYDNVLMISDKNQLIMDILKNNNFKVIDQYCDITPSIIISTVRNLKAVFARYTNTLIDDFGDSYNMEETQHPDLEKFKNIGKGSRIFIIATGPSLLVKDLQKLHIHKEITMSVNAVYKCFPLTNWRPDYYVVSDGAAIDAYGSEITRLGVNNIFLSDQGNIVSNSPSVYRYHSISCMSCLFDSNTNISENIVRGLYSFKTVMLDCLQIAFYMGFNKIYLLGADCSYNGKPCDSGNHFIDNYYVKGDRHANIPFPVDGAFMDYQIARHYAEQHGIKIFNATRGGKLEVFERVDFDSLF